MASTVYYKGQTLTTVNNQTRTLLTSGKYMEDDVTIIDVTTGGGCVDIVQDANGFLVLDENCPVNGTLTQDANGFLVFSTYDICGTRLEYEEGTWTPSVDTETTTIYFSNSHTYAPMFVAMSDESSDTAPASSYGVCLINNYSACFNTFASHYGIGRREYKNASDTWGASTASFTSLSSLEGYVTNEYFKPNGNSSGYYWRAGRTYKWIAVWR